jgi:hypothetical protein
VIDPLQSLALAETGRSRGAIGIDEHLSLAGLGLVVDSVDDAVRREAVHYEGGHTHRIEIGLPVGDKARYATRT